MTPIIRKFVLKLLSKDRGSGITSIPGSQHRMIQESIITDTLLKRGVNPESITSEGMLQSILNGIKKEDAMIARSKADAQKQLATVMDMKGRKIKPGAKIMGGEEVVETEAQIAERLGKGNKQAVENIKEKQLIESFDPDEMATGGRAGFKSGSYLMDGLRSLGKKYKGSTTQAILENPKLLGAELGHDGIMELMNLLPGLFAEGGRAGFAGGGMGRRAFLKLMAALGATGVAAKSGLVSLLGKGGGKQVAKEVVKETAGSGTVPPYFLRLVEKIKVLGDDTLATKDKAIAKKYKDYTMEEDFAGNIEIIKKGEDLQGNKLEDVYMSYKVDEVPLKKGGSKKIEEYEEFTARPDGDGKMKDVEQGIPDEVIEEAGDIDAMTLKKADGGRIEMAGGGSALKALINFFANKKGVKGSTFLKDINPKVLPEGIENIMGPGHLKALQKNQTDYVESLLDIIKSDKKFLNNFDKRVKEMVKTAPEGFEDVAENIGKQMIRSSMKDSRFERMKVYDKIDIDDAIVDVEQMIKNRRVKESDGRALNASGGLAHMLGE